MKLSHNKKRNTAFLYEVLITELTKTSLKGGDELQKTIVSTLKEFFSKGKILAEELSLYKEFDNLQGYAEGTIAKIISEVIDKRKTLDNKQIFNEQTKLINNINKKLGKETFENFVPNYKNLATIYQMFSDKTPIKSRVILENNLVKSLVDGSKVIVETNREQVDKVVYKIFTNKFNKKYSNLTENQRVLLRLYIESVRDGGLELKSFINEELSEIKTTIKEYTENQGGQELKDSLNKVKEEIESFKGQYINEEIIKKILKMQALTEEIKNGG